MLRKRIKKKKPLLSFTKHKLLHSIIKSKSTYFYKQRWFTYLIPSAAGLALLIMTIVAFNPMHATPTGYAMEVMTDDGVANNVLEIQDDIPTLEEGTDELVPSEIANDSSAEIMPRAATTSIAINWDVRDDIDQETYGKSGEVLYRYNRFTLSASNIYQYQILVSAAPGSSNNLIGYLDADHSSSLDVEISGITNASGEVGNNIPENQWGYAVAAGSITSASQLAGLTYKAVPAANAPTIAKSGNDSTLTDKPFTVAFGANIGSDKPAGYYGAAVQLSAVMTPLVTVIESAGFSSVTYMQDMTSSICTSAKIGATKQLIDKRDNKKYWVTKLQDNKCWMTQNLDLDLSTSRTLTPSDTDIQSNWTPSVSTAKTYENWEVSEYYNAEGSLDLGLYVRSGSPLSVSSCETNTTLDTTDCRKYGWTDVSTMTPMSTLNSNTTIETSSNTYNAHYLLGNHYSWKTATASGSTAVTAGQSAPNSICPKGWRLPTSGATSDWATLTQYLNSSTTNSANNFKAPPFYGVMGGYNSGKLYAVGFSGHYYSSTVVNPTAQISALVGNLSFGYNELSASDHYYGGRIFNVRCVAR